MKKFFLFFILMIVFKTIIYSRDNCFDLNETGLNQFVLRIGDGVTISDQMTEANTIYVIQNDFDLNNKIVSIPENCVLRFLGGSIKNGTLIGNNTYLEGNAEYILEKTLTFRNVDQFYLDGISFPKGKDISALAQRMLDIFNILELQTGTYYLSSPLLLKNYHAKIKGKGKRTVITTDRNIDYAIRTVFNSEVNTPGKYYNASFIEISDLMIDGGKTKKFKNGIFLDGPSCTVSNCYVTNIESVGVKLSEWCNNLFNCIITHCDIGTLIVKRANAVNVCYNRIESNNINIVVQDYRGVNIENNTIEGGAFFNIVVGGGFSCNIKDNYFEGGANSITDKLTTTEGRSLAFSSKKEIKSLLWIGAIYLSEKDYITEIDYKIGSHGAPTTVLIEDNYVDIHRDDKNSSLAPEVYFAIIGSCLDHCVINNNTFTHPQKAVCGFFDTDNAVLGNGEILNNYIAGTAQTNNAIDFIYDNYSKVSWRAKNHIVGELRLSEKNK